MSKMKLIMERWKRTEKELNEYCGRSHQRDEPAYGRDDEWPFMGALNDPAMDRDDSPEFEISDDLESASVPGQTMASGESVGGRTVPLDDWMTEDDPSTEELMTPASEEDLVDNFNDAFGLARRQGKAKFDYRGKKYLSRLEDESDIDWSQNLGMSVWDLHGRTGKVNATNKKWFESIQKQREDVEKQERESLRRFQKSEEAVPTVYGESKKLKKKYTLRLKG